MIIFYTYRKKFIRKVNKLEYDGKEYIGYDDKDVDYFSKNMSTLMIGFKEIDDDYSI